MSSRVVGAGGLWRSNWGRDTRLVQGIRTRRLFFAPFSLLAKKEKTTASPVSSCWWTGPSCGCDSDPPQSPPPPRRNECPRRGYQRHLLDIKCGSRSNYTAIALFGSANRRHVKSATFYCFAFARLRLFVCISFHFTDFHGRFSGRGFRFFSADRTFKRV